MAVRPGKMGNKGNTISVNMKGVEAASFIDAGRYIATVESIEKGISTKGYDKLTWVFNIFNDDMKKLGRIYHTTSLQPQALFSLKNILVNMGVEVPDGQLDLDLNDLIEGSVGVEVDIEEYEGKQKSKIVKFFPLED